MKEVKIIKIKPLVFKLRVSLEDVKPEVYRILLVPGSFNLSQLHILIQMSFGWNNTHLHEFKIGTNTYINMLAEKEHVLSKLLMLDEKSCILSSAFNLGENYVYAYDTGDLWVHEIKVIGVEEHEDYIEYPCCIEGQNACPPDNCGGPDGYEKLKAGLAGADLQERERLLRFVGGQFDPFSCDPNRLNRDMIWDYKWPKKKK